MLPRPTCAISPGYGLPSRPPLPPSFKGGRDPSGHPVVSHGLRYGAILLLGIAISRDMAGAYGDARYSTWLNTQLHTAIGILARNRVRHVYGDYWTCDWLAFETRERITCAVLNARLQRGLNRFGPYWPAVARDRDVWYVFRADRPEAASFDRAMHRVLGCFRRTVLPAFAIYRPLDPGTLCYSAKSAWKPTRGFGGEWKVPVAREVSKPHQASLRVQSPSGRRAHGWWDTSRSACGPLHAAERFGDECIRPLDVPWCGSRAEPGERGRP